MEVYKNGKIIVLEDSELGTNYLNEIFKLYPDCLTVFQKINKTEEVSNWLLDKIVERSSSTRMYATVSTIDSIELVDIWQSATWYVFYKIQDNFDLSKMEVIGDIVAGSHGEITNKDLNDIFNKTFVVEYCYKCKYFSNSYVITCAVNPETNLDQNNQCRDYIDKLH
jgi:hypothetical protein